jgi:dephospho-CoA kinase
VVVPQRTAVTKLTMLSTVRGGRATERRSIIGIDQAAVLPVSPFGVVSSLRCITFRPVFVVGLTGGVGSGKSTAAGLLTLHGAFLIDADQVAREVVEPKSPGLAAIVDNFGSEFVTRGGELDRRKMADLVFSDDGSRAALNEIVHPLVREHIEADLEAIASSDADRIIVLMVPLLVEAGTYPSDAVIVVDCDPDIAIRRLVEQRGWSASEAEARMRAQVSRKERLLQADYVIDNSGPIEDLGHEVARAWDWILHRKATG